MMIDLRQDLPGRLFHLCKINENAALVQPLSSQHYLHLPVVSMETFAFSTKISEIMGGGEVSYYFDFVEGFTHSGFSLRTTFAAQGLFSIEQSPLLSGLMLGLHGKGINLKSVTKRQKDLFIKELSTIN